MEFNVPKTHELFRQMIREFVEKEVKPIAAEVDENERFPMETVEKMAKIGIMGIPIPKEYGGAGGDYGQLRSAACLSLYNGRQTAVKGAGGFRGHEKGTECKGGGLICLL